jgi:hypothetical protein
MDRARKLIPIILLVIGLAGCFTSNKPLITPADAVFPFATFTYGEEGSESTTTFVRRDDAYALDPAPDGRMIELLFRKLPSGHYLAQMKGDQKPNPIYLYALLKVDFATGTAAAYKVVGGKDDVRPGLRSCPEKTICVDDLAAYVAAGEAAIAAGGKPDTVYAFTVKE